METPPKRLSHGRRKPSQHQEAAPTRGVMAPEAGPSEEKRYPRAPRRKDSSELPSLIPKCCRSETPPEVREGPEAPLPRHASAIAPFPGKRDARD